MLISVPIKDIKKGQRIREDFGDIRGLAISIDVNDLLNPITVIRTPEGYELVAGERRIEAFKFLGRDRIPAYVTDVNDPLQAQLDENGQRKNWNFSERMKILQIIEGQRLGHRAKKNEKGAESSPFLSQNENKGRKSRDIASDVILGQVSASELQKEKRIWQRINEYPNELEYLRKQLDNEEIPRDAAEKAIKNKLNDVMRKADNEELLKKYDTLPDKDKYQFETCDFTKRELTDKYLKRNSVPLICSDPDWHDEKLPLYIEMGKFACDYLEPGRSMVLTMPFDVYTAMNYVLKNGNINGQLHFKEFIIVLMEGGRGFPRNYGSDTVHKAKILLWVMKGHKQKSGYPKEEYIRNLVIRSRTPDKSFNYMSQSHEDFKPAVEGLTRINDRVVDPMRGAGTTAITCMLTKRRFLGFDIREEAKEEAKANLAIAAEELLPLLPAKQEHEELTKLHEKNKAFNKILHHKSKRRF